MSAFKRLTAPHRAVGRAISGAVKGAMAGGAGAVPMKEALDKGGTPAHGANKRALRPRAKRAMKMPQSTGPVPLKNHQRMVTGGSPQKSQAAMGMIGASRGVEMTPNQMLRRKVLKKAPRGQF